MKKTVAFGVLALSLVSSLAMATPRSERYRVQWCLDRSAPWRARSWGMPPDHRLRIPGALDARAPPVADGHRPSKRRGYLLLRASQSRIGRPLRPRPRKRRHPLLKLLPRHRRFRAWSEVASSTAFLRCRRPHLDERKRTRLICSRAEINMAAPVSPAALSPPPSTTPDHPRNAGKLPPALCRPRQSACRPPTASA